MRAIILCAGQGRRMLPLTADRPKCLLPILGDVPLLGMQLRVLESRGVRDVSVVVGFEAEAVEKFLKSRPVPGIRTRVLYNPFYRTTDNLVSCWLARDEMREDFVLLNGDTVFEPEVLRRLLAAPTAPLTLAIDRKGSYDADDMKVSTDPSGRLRAVAKDLPAEVVNGESIGMMVFRRSGPAHFVRALDAAVRHPDSALKWYLSIVDRMAHTSRVQTASIEGLWWGEVDCLSDLEHVREDIARRAPLLPAAQPRPRAGYLRAI